MSEQKEQSEKPSRVASRRRFGVLAAIAILAVLAGVYGIGHLRSNPDTGAWRQAGATAGRIVPPVHCPAAISRSSVEGT